MGLPDTRRCPSTEREIKIEFPDTRMFEQMLDVIRKVHNHELASPELKAYIRLELARLLKGYGVNILQLLGEDPQAGKHPE